MSGTLSFDAVILFLWHLHSLQIRIHHSVSFCVFLGMAVFLASSTLSVKVQQSGGAGLASLMKGALASLPAQVAVGWASLGVQVGLSSLYL